ncbi:MAG: nuclear transport factor 2 family protein [Actinomycetota bacterium]
MSEAHEIDVLRKVMDGFNAHDVESIVGYFTDDAVFESPRGPDPWGRRYVGKDAVRDGFAARFEGIPDVHYEDGGHFACGDRGVSEWTLTGTTTSGERVEVNGCDLWTFRDAQIVVKNSFWKIVDLA